MLKGIIFDFDGVIAKSVQVKTNAFATLYFAYGDNVVKNVVNHHEANVGMSRFEKIKYYHKTFLNITLTKKEIAELADRFSELVIDRVIKAPYVPGVLDYIQKKNKKYKLFISSGTPTDEIRQILNARKIADYFTDVYGSPEKKSFHLDQIMTNYHLRPDELIFYGDANTDLEASENAHIKFILVKNQFNKYLFQNYKGEVITNFISLL